MDMVGLFLERCREEFEEGSSWALMQAIEVCCREGRSVPQWAAKAFIAGYEKCRLAEAKSWDDVFGRPYPKGTHHLAVNKRHRLMNEVSRRVRAIREHEPGTPIDEALFERVGSELEIGKTLAAEFYYYAKRLDESI